MQFPTPELQALMHPYTGHVADVRPPRGFSADLVAVLRCENGTFFVKAVRNEGMRRVSIRCELAINPFVQPISPPVLWQAENDEWIVLGFEAVDGRRADFGVDSADLPVVVGLMNRIGALGLPEVAHRWHERRWDRFVGDEAEAELFRGDALLHVDINPDNFIIAEQGAWVVDWAGPSRGAAFIDPAVLVVQLVSSGHTPEAAESWAARCEAWTEADPHAIDAFAAATTRMYWTAATRRPEESWLRAMAEAAEAWANHRGVVVTA
ncbi:protein kinase [Streptomyces sp. B6B3]|uniref:protein kinase n=1 Tax=Streptomyces sp. B6B3 TaxID=3153570 RepID=UPI00325F1319